MSASARCKLRVQASSDEGGGAAARASGPGAEAAPLTFSAITLADLIEHGQLAPGARVLKVQVKDEALWGDLLPDGTVRTGGQVYTAVTALANAVAEAAGTQCKNGWTAITYQGRCGAAMHW